MAEANLDPGPGVHSGPISAQSEQEFVERGMPALRQQHYQGALEQATGTLSRHFGMVRALDGRPSSDREQLGARQRRAYT